MDDKEVYHMCEECGQQSKNKLTLAQHFNQKHEDEPESKGVNYRQILETIGGSKKKPSKCDLCNRSPPGYVEFIDINGENVCGRCLKRLGEEVDNDRVNKWETEELVPKNL